MPKTRNKELFLSRQRHYFSMLPLAVKKILKSCFHTIISTSLSLCQQILKLNSTPAHNNPPDLIVAAKNSQIHSQTAFWSQPFLKMGMLKWPRSGSPAHRLWRKGHLPLPGLNEEINRARKQRKRRQKTWPSLSVYSKRESWHGWQGYSVSLLNCYVLLQAVCWCCVHRKLDPHSSLTGRFCVYYDTELVSGTITRKDFRGRKPIRQREMAI